MSLFVRWIEMRAEPTPPQTPTLGPVESGDGTVIDPEAPILVIGKQEYGDSVISEALKRKGYRLKAVPDGQEPWRWSRRNP
jgi:hypothetical protein